MKHPEEYVGDVLLGKWHLDELIGIGAMATVFAATHRNGKRVAIKLLHAHMAEEPVIVRRFLREGYAANRVGHPAVVSAHDDNTTEDGIPFLVLDLVRGHALDELLLTAGPMPPNEVLRIADQVLDALVAAHEKGVLHRDLKPENLILEPGGTVRILDFGIARIDQEEPRNQRLTIQGRAMGTPGYMAPEQAQGLWERVDARSDLWSLGATMFALLTGREVHVADTPHELLIASLTKPVQPIRTVAPSLSEETANIVDRALAFHPGDRFPSARVMQEWVRDALGPSVETAIPEGPVSQSPTVISHGSTPAPLPPGRLRRGALSFSIAAAVCALVHVTAAKTTGDPRVVLPPAASWEAPVRLVAGLPHDAAATLLEPPVSKKTLPEPDVTLPPVELEEGTIDLDALEPQPAASAEPYSEGASADVLR